MAATPVTLHFFGRFKTEVKVSGFLSDDIRHAAGGIPSHYLARTIRSIPPIKYTSIGDNGVHATFFRGATPEIEIGLLMEPQQIDRELR